MFCAEMKTIAAPTFCLYLDMQCNKQQTQCVFKQIVYTQSARFSEVNTINMCLTKSHTNFNANKYHHQNHLNDMLSLSILHFQKVHYSHFRFARFFPRFNSIRFTARCHCYSGKIDVFYVHLLFPLPIAQCRTPIVERIKLSAKKLYELTENRFVKQKNTQNEKFKTKNHERNLMLFLGFNRCNMYTSYAPCICQIAYY